jgi:hypothetical protein
MGWDAGLNRILAVPVVVNSLTTDDLPRFVRTRTLRTDVYEPEEFETLCKLAENRVRIEKLRSDLETSPCVSGSINIPNELDYLKAEIGLELLEMVGDIDEIPSSEEFMAEAFA